MKPNKWMIVLAATLVTGIGSVAWAITNDIFRIKLSVQGAAEVATLTNVVSKVKTNGVTYKVTNVVVNARIQKILMDEADWINLGLGRDLGTKPPDNVVLATETSEITRQFPVLDLLATNPLIVPVRILVFDTALGINLATIGNLTVDQKAAGNKKNKYSSEVTDTLQILPTGNPLNGFTNGSLSVDIQCSLTASGTVKSATGTMLGWFVANIRSNNWQTTRDPVSTVPVLVRTAKFQTKGKPIGTFVVPDIGSLTVTINPAAAAGAGAQWQVDGGTLMNSGETNSNLSVGSHTVTFSTVSGYATPTNLTVIIIRGATTTVSGTYL